MVFSRSGHLTQAGEISDYLCFLWLPPGSDLHKTFGRISAGFEVNACHLRLAEIIELFVRAT